ncbi:MAG: MMPL family transporter [Pseudomonadota bacterium]
MNSASFETAGRVLADWSIRFRWLVVAASILLCLGVSYGASNLKFASDYRVFFGADNPDFVANERAQGTFGKADNVAFLLIPKDATVFDEDTLAATLALTDAAWTLPYVSRVDSLTNFQSSRGENDDLIVEDVLFELSELTPDRIAYIENLARSEPLLNRFLVSEDGSATIVNAVLQLPSDIPAVSVQAAEKAAEIAATLVAAHPNHEVQLLGVVILSASFETAGQVDSQTLIPLVYALILVVIFAVFRSIFVVGISLALILLSTLFAMGIGGFAGVQLTPISLSAPTIILTIAVADAIHIFSGVRGFMRDGMAKREALVASVSLNFAPVAITSITTIVGFLTLNFSDSPPFHHLGNITAAGIFAAWVLSILFLPALASFAPLSFKPTAAQARPDLMRRMADMVVRHAAVVFGVTATLSAAAIAFIPQMELNDQWTKYFAPRLDFRQAVDAAAPLFGTEPMEFVIDSGAPGNVTNPEFLAVVDAFTLWLRDQDDVVTHAFAVSDIMKRLNRNLNNEDPAFDTMPDAKDLAAQYLLVYELSLPYGLDLNDRVDIDRQTTRVTATTRDVTTNQTKAFIADAEAWFAQNGNGVATVEVTGAKKLFAFVAQRNIEAMFEGAIYLVLAIVAILSLTFGSLRVGLLSLIPNALPILITFGLWSAFVGTVGFSVAATGAVAVGLVVDFTVHFMAKYLRATRDKGQSVADGIRYAFDTAGTAILATTVILTAGFAVLLTSSFKFNADLGLLTAISIVMAMIVNFFLLPSLLMLGRAKTPPNTTTPLKEATS